jgi:hypothetical protein
MLRSVGHPIAVNPDRGLTRVALAEGWPIVEFEHRVPLRERLALPTTRRSKIITATGVVIVIGSVVAAASILHRRTTASVQVRRPAAS